MGTFVRDAPSDFRRHAGGTRSSAVHAAAGVLFALVLLAKPQVSFAAPASDTDGDGYDDMTELANGYSPYGPGKLAETDTDGDGLSDADEIVFGSDPLRPDTDGDGFPDGLEVLNAFDPTLGGGARLKKRIVISLASQTLDYSIGPKHLGSFKVSTGKARTPTPVGVFAIRDKKPRAWSAHAKLYMPYWMPFIGTQYGLHELPEWPDGTKEGQWHLGTPASGGCVRLGVGPAKTLYEWSEIGTEVEIKKA